jgi:uncharacterized protein (DUF427 family)
MPLSNRPQRIPPKPGQESVWDYPRPPRVDPSAKQVRVVLNGVTIATSRRAIRILETSHPPIYYIPPTDIQMIYLSLTQHQTFCEFKGMASYYTIIVGDKRLENAAWFYPQPSAGYEAIRNYVAFYAGRMDACYVDDERVVSQPGDFYGGWITADIVGPFKGDPQYNTRGW